MRRTNRVKVPQSAQGHIPLNVVGTLERLRAKAARRGDREGDDHRDYNAMSKSSAL